MYTLDVIWNFTSNSTRCDTLISYLKHYSAVGIFLAGCTNKRGVLKYANVKRGAFPRFAKFPIFGQVSSRSLVVCGV